MCNNNASQFKKLRSMFYMILINLLTTHQRKKTTVKYTAAKLHEKGVLLKIEGLTTNQYVPFHKYKPCFSLL